MIKERFGMDLHQHLSTKQESLKDSLIKQLPLKFQALAQQYQHFILQSSNQQKCYLHDPEYCNFLKALKHLVWPNDDTLPDMFL